MNYSFDTVIDRRSTDSIKWHYFEEDVLPMWVADMDFEAPPAVIEALHDRINHGIFGYAREDPELKEILMQRLEELYHWKVTAEDLIFLPGVVNGFNLAVQALGQPDKELLIQTPVYPPFFGAAENAGMKLSEARLELTTAGRYEIDWDRFEERLGQETGVFLLCNPHNPVGRVYSQDELSRMAEACLRNGVPICSDEIHCDLVFSNAQHIPIASLDPQIAAQTITLMAPSKTFNIPGLGFSFAVVPNPELRRKLKLATRGLVGHVNLLGMAAAKAAYREGGEWLKELLIYLESNRDYLFEWVRNEFEGIRMASPEGTYLAWLDCREAGLGNDPAGFFVKNARVGLSDGQDFGQDGKGFVRMNFGCPQSVLTEGLERMRAALEAAGG